MKRSKTFRPKGNVTLGGYVADKTTSYVDDLMHYDGTKEDYYGDASSLGFWDAFTNGMASKWRQQAELGQKLEDTMEMFGLSWSDMRYPALTAAFGATTAAVGSTVHFVSDNVRLLYR